jgi:hypothetical protein
MLRFTPHKIRQELGIKTFFTFSFGLEIWICTIIISRYACKGKAVPLQGWSGPEGSRKLSFPDYMKTAQEQLHVGMQK